MQSNSELWLDRTLRNSACGTWWVAGTPAGQTLGTLQLDPDLVAAPEARERVAATVAAVRAANPPGVLRTTELVYDSRRAWLVVATPPQPTLADLLAADRTLPAGAAAGIAVDVAEALRALHAAGLHHGDLTPATVVLTGAGAARLAEVGVLAAVRGAPVDIEADAVAWGALARALAARAPDTESSLLVQAASVAEAGDLPSAARRLALAAADLPDFTTRDGLAALLPTLEPAPTPDAPPPAPVIPTQRSASSVDNVIVRLRFGPGVPDAALLNPRPVEAPPAPPAARPARRVRAVVAWLTAAAAVVLVGAAAAGWLLVR